MAAEDVASDNFLSELISENKLDENGELVVRQNEDGIDSDDRIQVCNDFLVEINGIISGQ